MKVVIAPDSFKESLSALEAAQAIARGATQAVPELECVLRPIADGGEGTVDALLASVPGSERRCGSVRGAYGSERHACWGWLGDGRAIVEVSAAAGLAQTPPEHRNPLVATTFGVGQHILAALDAGARHIILGLGGSATNDAGAGMLQALGARLLDEEGQELPGGGAALARLCTLDLSGLDPRLARTEFTVACDVDNVLCGPQGASAVFGPQKGAMPDDVRVLDAALSRFADICRQTLGRDARDLPGAGAAGGMGFAALAFLDAVFQPGVELVAASSGLREAMQDADLVITGEGRLDAQTLQGKAPAGVARLAQSLGVPVVVLAGSLGPGYQALYAQGVTAAFSLAPGPIELAHAREHAAALLAERACDVMRLWHRSAGAPA